MPQAARRKTVSRLASFFAPDLALSGAVFSLVYLMLFFGGPSALFRDADAGWHIRAGERMIESRALPATDTFSFSKAGQPWIAWEWAADVAVGAVHQVAGLSGVAWLYMLAIGAVTWMWFRLNWAAGGNFVLACLFAAPMLSTVNLHWLARPHVFGWLFALGVVWWCEAGKNAPDRRISWFLLAAVWANVHGTFFLGPLILLVYGLWKPALAALAGTLVNPHGWDLHRHVWSYLTDSALLDRIGEFQSFNFHAEGSAQIMLALMIGAWGGFAALSVRRWDRFLLSTLITGAALRSARMLPLAALLLLPLANGTFCAQLHSRLRGVLDYGARLRALDRGMNGLALVPVIALVLFGVVHATHPAFPADQFPVGAVSAVAALPADAKLFSSDKFGGYLIYEFAGERKVYFDGRSDFYGAEFLKSYARLVQARPGWREEFARQGFTHALLPPDYSLVAALETDGWREVYRNGTAVLLKGPQS
jgi:hypothetical protein